MQTIKYMPEYRDDTLTLGYPTFQPLLVQKQGMQAGVK